MADRFTLTNKHTKTFIGFSILGAILICLGLWMSEMSGGGDHEDHGDEASHASLVLADAGQHGGTHIENDADVPVNMQFHQGLHHTPKPNLKKKMGVVFLIGTWFFFALGAFGVFIIAMSYVAHAGWYVTVKRIMETFYRWLPVAAIMMVAGFLIFGNEIYEWFAIANGAEADPVVKRLVEHKASFLNSSVYLTLVLLMPMLLFMFGRSYRKLSLEEEIEGGTKIYYKSKVLGAFTLPVFAFTIILLSWQVLMSIDATWFSTIFWVYCFSGLFVAGMTVTLLITLDLKKDGYMKEVNEDVIHDMAKFTFAFSVFWAYMWISQYLLIWYANIPEEGVYFVERIERFQGLFYFNVFINFVFPFLALMTRNSKRRIASLKIILWVLLFGRFCDIYLMIVPGTVGEHANFGLMLASVGMLFLLAGGFLFIVYKGIAAAPLMAKNHPFYQESLHHDVGV